MKTARFWICHPTGGLVRIKLSPSQTLHYHHYAQTDEGWHTECGAYSFDGHIVSSQWHSDGVDCDGRMSQSGESYCPVSMLSAGYQEDGIAFPAWEKGEHSQRDYSAEAMGY